MRQPGQYAVAASGGLASLLTPPKASSVYMPLKGCAYVAVVATAVLTPVHELTRPEVVWARAWN